METWIKMIGKLRYNGGTKGGGGTNHDNGLFYRGGYYIRLCYRDNDHCDQQGIFPKTRRY